MACPARPWEHNELIGPELTDMHKQFMKFERSDAETENKPALGEECAICFLPMLKEQNLWQLPCGHVFHTDCIGEWAAPSLEAKTRGQRAKKTCPICRKEFDISDDFTALKVKMDTKRRFTRSLEREARREYERDQQQVVFARRPWDDD